MDRLTMFIIMTCITQFVIDESLFCSDESIATNCFCKYVVPFGLFECPYSMQNCVKLIEKLSLGTSNCDSSNKATTLENACLSQ